MSTSGASGALIKRPSGLLVPTEHQFKLDVPKRAQPRFGNYVPMHTGTAPVFRADEVERKAAVAPDFGAPGGTPISNIHDILPDTWEAFGRRGPPAVMYVLVKGDSNWGHAAIAYVRHEHKLMNIVGGEKARLVNFMPPEEYVWGVDRMRDGNPERGAYNREMEIVCIWECSDKVVEKLDRNYRHLDQLHAEGKAAFELALPRTKTAWANVRGIDIQYGNCAYFTSLAMYEAGLIPHPTMWPREIALMLLQGEGRRDPNNLDIMYVPWIRHAVRTKSFAPETRLISPVAQIKYWRFPHLAQIAGARIGVPDDSMVARVERRDRAWSRV